MDGRSGDRISSAHYELRARLIRVDGRPLTTAPNSEIADMILTDAGYTLVGDWLSANLGFTRLVTKRADAVADDLDVA
jgi:hypothetical protein